MKENGLYTIKKEYFEIMNKIGQSETNGGHRRPVYCCIEDNKIKGLYWAIPTSDYAHRTPAQKVKIGKFINLPTKDLRSSYYHLAKTTKDAVYKISSVFPVTDKYIDHEFVTQGVHVVMKKRKMLMKSIGN